MGDGRGSGRRGGKAVTCGEVLVLRTTDAAVSSTGWTGWTGWGWRWVYWRTTTALYDGLSQLVLYIMLVYSVGLQLRVYEHSHSHLHAHCISHTRTRTHRQTPTQLTVERPRTDSGEPTRKPQLDKYPLTPAHSTGPAEEHVASARHRQWRRPVNRGGQGIPTSRSGISTKAKAKAKLDIPLSPSRGQDPYLQQPSGHTPPPLNSTTPTT